MEALKTSASMLWICKHTRNATCHVGMLPVMQNHAGRKSNHRCACPKVCHCLGVVQAANAILARQAQQAQHQSCLMNGHHAWCLLFCCQAKHTWLPYTSLAVSSSSAREPATMLLCASSAERWAADITLGTTVICNGLPFTASAWEFATDRVCTPATEALTLLPAHTEVGLQGAVGMSEVLMHA